MKNKYAFFKARQIDASLNGDNWPEKLTILQIENLHFVESRNEKRALFSLLENSLGAGLLNFDDVTAGYSWSYGVLSDLVGGSNEKEMTSSHTPDSGWGKFFIGLKVGDVKDLSLHPCGCEAVCILEQVFSNGLPRRWLVKGIHLDGLKIEFSCRAIPLISPDQYLAFCAENGVLIPEESCLNDWVNKWKKRKGNSESPQTLACKSEALKIGEYWMTEQRKEGKNPGVDAIAKYVATEFKRLDIRGARNDYLSWQTIKKEFLTGITGKPANGKHKIS